MAFVKSLATGLVQEVPADHWALTDRANFEVVSLEDVMPEVEEKPEPKRK